MKIYLFLFLFILIPVFAISSVSYTENGLPYGYREIRFDFSNNNDWIILQDSIKSVGFFGLNPVYIDKIDLSFDLFDINNYEMIGLAQKKEHFLRRFEVLFIGSITIVSFFAWIGLSIFNSMILGEAFGILRRDQILYLYATCSIVSFAIAIGDLLSDIEIKNDIIKLY